MTFIFSFFSSICLRRWLQTANLDGETNLKIRKALEKTWDYLTPVKASEFKGLAFLLHHLSFLSVVDHDASTVICSYSFSWSLYLNHMKFDQHFHTFYKMGGV